MDQARRPGQQRPVRPNARRNRPFNRTNFEPIDPVVLTSFVIPAAVLIVFANATVICVILRTKSLRKLRNMPLVSLAFADLTIGAFLGPMLTDIQLTPGRAHVCKFYLVAEVFCYTSSLLNMLVVSIERWIAIFQPLHYERYVTPLLIWGMIALAWVFSFITAASNSWYVGGILHRRCVYSWPRRGSYPLIFCGAFFTLSLIMGVMQVKIYLVVRSHRRRIAPIVSRENCTNLDVTVHNASLTPTPRNSHTVENGQSTQMNDARNIDTLAARVAQAVRGEGRRPSLVAHVVLTRERLVENSANDNSTFVTINLDDILKHDAIQSVLPPVEVKGRSISVISRNCGHVDTPPLESVTQGRKRRTRAKMSYLKLQQKTTQVVSLLHLLFILMWSPYIITALVNHSGRPANRCIIAAVVTKALMFCNSFVNPFIFTIRIREFRVALRNLICRKR